MLTTWMEKKGMTMYRLAKTAGVPYSTVNDLCSGKTRLEKCSAETVYRISKALDVSMEELLAPCFLHRCSFENFKSAVCHRVKEMGDMNFIINTLESKEIRIFFERKWYPESFYLLAMLDYISRINGVPLCNEYDDIRRCKLEKPIFPAGLRALLAASWNDDIIKKAEDMAIPEFIRFNIVENEVRNVI